MSPIVPVVTVGGVYPYPFRPGMNIMVLAGPRVMPYSRSTSGNPVIFRDADGLYTRIRYEWLVSGASGLHWRDAGELEVMRNSGPALPKED